MTGQAVRYLPAVVAPEGPEPEDIGTGHEMRRVTELVARDPSSWTAELAARVGGFFDERADDWAAGRSGPSEVLADALDRGGPFAAPVLELGAGAGAGTRVLCDRFDDVVAGDLAAGMLRHLRAAVPAACVRLDASALPVATRSVGTVVAVNMLLFADEVRRVLAPGGALVWVNSIGERTPIHLPAEQVAASLGDGVEVTASRAAWGTWAVARLTATS